MKKHFKFIFLVFTLASCNKLTERHYKNTDLTNGGFIDIKLDLNADNTLTLTKITQKAVNQNNAGSSYQPDTLSVTGTWEVGKDQIRCEIKESEEFIGEAFFKPDFKTKGISDNYNQIIFPIKTDTIYIFGQPCIAKIDNY